MSDARLRELERRWRREASVEVFCELAAACARSGLRAPPADEAGVWAPRRLALGARLGDADARRALGLPGEPAPEDASAWVLRLEAVDAAGPTPWAKELFVRVAAAVVRATALACEDSLLAAFATTDLDRLERWAAAGAPHDDADRARRDLVAAHLETLKFNARYHGTRNRALLAMTSACAVVTTPGPARDAAGSAAHHASLVVGAPAVVAAVRRELVPWALFGAGPAAAAS